MSDKSLVKIPHDSFVKKVLGNRITAKDFLEEHLSVDVIRSLDLRTIKVEKESYVDDNLKNRYSDLVYSVKTKKDKK